MGRQYVNAVMLRVEAPTRELGRIIQTAAVRLARGAQHLSSPVSDKTVLMSTSATQAVVVQQGMRHCGLKCNGVRSARDLEIDATLGRKRRPTCAAKRRQQASARLHKLSRFQGLEHRRLLQSTTILAKATCGTAVMEWHRTSRRNCELRRSTAWESSEEGVVQALQFWCTSETS